MGEGAMIIAAQIPTYDTTRIGYICPIHTYFYPYPSAFIHGDLWRSFRVLDRGDLGLFEYIEKYFGKLTVM